MSDNNVAFALAYRAEQEPDATALVIPVRTRAGWTERRWSAAELEDRVARLGRGLRARGFGPGQRIALMVPPSLDFFALFYALLRSGCIPVLIDPGIGLRPLKTCLAEARPEAFVGVTRAHLARLLLGWGRGSVRRTITSGRRLGWRSASVDQLLAEPSGPPPEPVAPDDPAAILFTSGSTGIPKGVVYRHRHFAAQVELLRETFDMHSGEVDLPTFPPFALFDPALGMTTVLPPMDYTRPARADPAMLVALIRRYGVTNLFGSPALLRPLGRYLAANDIRMPGLRRVLSAGAPVPPEVIETILGALDPGADIHTPYGATECLPVATITGRELVGEPSRGNGEGKGICVGRPLAANRLRLIRVTGAVIDYADDAAEVGPGEVGEIAVLGPTTTDSYWQRPQQTRAAKMTNADGAIWHRMGDLAWMDRGGRLWFCGRKSERVRTAKGDLYTEPVEGIFNAHPGVTRSALVGVGPAGEQVPVLVVEPEAKAERASLRRELLALAERRALTRDIRAVLFYRGFPVDIRHNAKIRRSRLAAWAARKLRTRAGRRLLDATLPSGEERA